jgi:hypothetical protein
MKRESFEKGEILTMPAIICPKCGHSQADGVECHRCGVIFERCRSASTARNASFPEPRVAGAPAGPSPLRKLYRVFRWACLGLLLTVLVLILWPAQPPRIPVSPEAMQRAEVKVSEFQDSASRGRASSIELEEAEVNGWIASNLALKSSTSSISRDPAPSDDARMEIARKAMNPGTAPLSSPEEIRSSIKDLRVELKDDSLSLYASFEANGMPFSLELSGRLAVQEGYLRMVPLAGKLGSLPLTVPVLDAALKRIFESPENREKFHLPPQIRDVRIQNGRLVIDSR